MYWILKVIMCNSEDHINCTVQRLYTTKEKAVKNVGKVLDYTLEDDFVEDKEERNKIVNDIIKYFEDNNDLYAYKSDIDYDFSFYIFINKIEIEE